MAAAAVGGGLQPFVAGGGAAQGDRGVAVDAAVVARTLDELPLAFDALDLDHRDAFGGQGLAHFLGGGRFLAVVKEVAVVGVFVIDRQQCVVRLAGDREQAHAVVVVTELHFLSFSRAFARGVEGRAIGVQRLAPADQYVGLVAGRQADVVVAAGLDAGEAQQLAVAFADTHGQGAAAEQVAAEEQRRTTQGSGADEAAAGEANHLLEVGGLVVF